MNRTLLLPVLIAAALGLPWLMSSGSSISDYGQPPQPGVSQAAPGLDAMAWNGGLAPGSPPLSPGKASPFPTMEFMPAANLAEVLRFDIQPEWIKSRWDRVSVGGVYEGLTAYRVALVTGVNPWDLAGSLTYHVDDRQQIQKIDFQGWTGDATQLVHFLTRQYGFKPQRTNLAGLHIAKSWGRETGVAILKHPPVIRNDFPNQRVAVAMEINNPKGRSLLSDPMRELLVQARSGN